LTKSLAVAKEYKCKTILVSGGVAANGFLRRNFENNKDVKIIFPERKHCTDNGIMIACRGLIDYLADNFTDAPKAINVMPQLNFL
jgi:N6-L-threonylcarbamoyladenine synthase